MKTPKKTVDERFINKHLISQILDQYTQTIISEKDIDVRIKGRTREKVDLVKIFCKIDRLEPNKEDLMKLVNSASEETRGKWLRLVRKTELLMKYPSEIEVVESEIVAHE